MAPFMQSPSPEYGSTSPRGEMVDLRKMIIANAEQLAEITPVADVVEQPVRTVSQEVASTVVSRSVNNPQLAQQAYENLKAANEQ